MSSDNLMSQKSSLEDYQWNSRVVLILAKVVNEKYINQIQEFKNGNDDELKERKIVLIEVQNGKYRISDPEINKIGNSKWNPTNGKFEKFLADNDDFRIILIGLDGGVKINKKEVISRIELFGEIDSMPMRKAELKNR